MARTLARSVCGLAALASFAACGGVADPFSASGSSGTGNGSAQAGASSEAGASARSGAPNTGGSSAAGAPGADGGAVSGGSPAGGSSDPGVGGSAQAGSSSVAGASTGGSANTGGSAGSSASAGTSSGGSGGDTCQTLFAKASKQLAAAQVCSNAADSLQCTGTVKNPCKCEVPVNRQDSDETKAYQATLDELNQKKCVQVCTAIACLPVAHAQCVSSNSTGSTGTCSASHAIPL
ncbi:MAG: hypothetical protein ABW061_14975 [Polyangiaceae bacterium]